MLGAIVWIPLQVINFKIISPQYRVAYVASLVLLEVNILCVIQKFSPDNINKKIRQYCGNSVNGDLESSTKIMPEKHNPTNSEHGACSVENKTLKKLK